MQKITVPELGESVSEATIARWLKSEGDKVAADEPVVELETDKVTLEVNAPQSGIISKIIVTSGETVEVGTVIGEISKTGAGETTPDKSADKSADSTDDEMKLSPAVRKLVEENGLNPKDIPATGKDGRLLKGDVIKYLEDQTQPATQKQEQEEQKKTGAASIPLTQVLTTHPIEENDISSLPKGHAAGLENREERIKMTELRKTIAKKLKNAQNTAAILTTFNEVDMSNIIALRKQHKESFEKKHDIKLGFMSFFVKAVVNALKEFPAVNAEISGDDIIYKNYYNIGIAVSTPQGLVVPVVRNCESKSMAEIEKAIVDIGTRARDGKLAMAEMSGGTFTITNGGVFGSLMSTPILNAPQSGILGMHKIQQRAMVMPDGSIQARPMMYLALSYDHRIIDGREAVSFLVRVKESVEDPQRLLLDI